MKKIVPSIQNFSILFFLTLAVLSAINFSVFRFIQLNQQEDALVVDLAGRNRMLSQKIAFQSEALLDGVKDAKNQLNQAIDLHDSSLQVLRFGGVGPAMNSERELPAVSQNVHPELTEVELLWEQYRNNALVIANYDVIRKEMSKFEHPDEISRAVKYIEDEADNMLGKNNDLVKALVKDAVETEMFSTLLIGLLTINLALLLIGYRLFKTYALDNINKLADVSVKVASGNGEKLTLNHTDPKLKDISNSINNLSDIVSQSIQFADNVGKGDFDFEFDQKNGSNRLFGELDKMKTKLKEIAREDEKRNWITTGMAQFAEKLRKNQDNSELLAETVLADLVKYLNANQGAVYFVQTGDDDDNYLELMASYAWGRKKFLTKTVKKGQGLIGQAWVEEETIYMTDVPSDFISITSGLGDANPNAIIIVPMKINESVMGIVEIATFNQFEQYQIEFVEKIGENIASTLTNIKSGEDTRRLLSDSQEQADMMRSQEEEMKQNMEELAATQETMQRKEQELTSLLEASMNNVKQNLNELAVRIESSIEAGKKELNFLSNVPPVQGIIRTMKNEGIDPLDGSTYDVWLDRFLVILHFLLDAKGIYGSVQFVRQDQQICKVSFANGITSEERDVKIEDNDFLGQLEKLKPNKIFVFPPSKTATTFSIAMGLPIYHEGEYFGSLVINLLGDEIIDSIVNKEDDEYGYKLISSGGETLFNNKQYQAENEFSTEVTINKEKGYSFKIISMQSGS